MRPGAGVRTVHGTSTVERRKYKVCQRSVQKEQCNTCNILTVKLLELELAKEGDATELLLLLVSHPLFNVDIPFASTSSAMPLLSFTFAHSLVK